MLRASSPDVSSQISLFLPPFSPLVSFKSSHFNLSATSGLFFFSLRSRQRLLASMTHRVPIAQGGFFAISPDLFLPFSGKASD